MEHGLLLENLLDLAHAPFTHTTTFAKGWPVPDVVKFNAARMLGGNWEPYPIDMAFEPPCMVLSTIGEYACFSGRPILCVHAATPRAYFISLRSIACHQTHAVHGKHACMHAGAARAAMRDTMSQHLPIPHSRMMRCMVPCMPGLAQPGKIMRGARASGCKNHLHQLHVCLPAGPGRTRLLYRMSMDFLGWTRWVPGIQAFWASIAQQARPLLPPPLIHLKRAQEHSFPVLVPCQEVPCPQEMLSACVSSQHGPGLHTSRRHC